MTQTFFILGGYGGTGRILCHRLLQHTDVSLIVGGRSKEKAEVFAQEIKREFPPERIRATYAEASQYDSLVLAFQGVSMIIVASTTPQYAGLVAKAALAVGADYLDYHFQQDVVETLKGLEGEIQKAGRCFITQAGFHPGLPAAFVRYAGKYLNPYQKAFIGMAMGVSPNGKIEKAESLYEIVDVLQDPRSEIFKNGQWKKGDYKDTIMMDLGPFGRQRCYPMEMQEIFPLPDMYKALTDVGVYVAGFNWFLDYLVFPIGMLLGKIKKGCGRNFLAQLMAWGLNHVRGYGEGVAFAIHAVGEKNGRPLSLHVLATHHDGYDFTAIPVVACLRQYLEGSIKKPGVWMMGHLVDPEKLFVDMEMMGVKFIFRHPPS